MMDNFARDLATVAGIDVIPTILEVVCRTTGLRFAAVARVTEDRWIACAVRDEIAFGLKPGGELPVESTICNEIRSSGRHVVIDHVAENGAFFNHHTPKIYGFQSYLSMPVFRRNGEFFGTLCAIDPRPARLNTPATLGMFKLFADLIGFHLDVLDRMASDKAALLDERRTGELREQFIAVLGHDLRNPLASVEAGMMLLQKSPLSAQAGQVLGQMRKSTARMSELIDNVLDFARGRLGGGLQCTRCFENELGGMLEQVVAELRSSWPDRIIQCDLILDGPVYCDGPRVAQLLSNLLANALTHGDPAGPIRLHVRYDENGFRLSVVNQCEPIPPDSLARLFQPFARASAKPGQHGLGLGLYIASEIARAHFGSLQAVSTREETRFTFCMPQMTQAHQLGN